MIEKAWARHLYETGEIDPTEFELRTGVAPADMDETFKTLAELGLTAGDIGQKRVVHNEVYGFHDRVWESTSISYNVNRVFVDRQEIVYGGVDGNGDPIEGYDRWGNALYQTVDSFDAEGALIEHKVIQNVYTGEDVMTIDGVIVENNETATPYVFENYSLLGKTYAVYVDGKLSVGAGVDEATGVITFAVMPLSGQVVEVRVEDGIKDPAVAARRGNAITTTIERYVDKGASAEYGEEHLIERQVLKTDTIDRHGNVVGQTIDTFVVDDRDGQTKLASRRVSENFAISLRGDAGIQHVTTLMTDDSGLESSLLVSSYQEMKSREYDSDHNVKNQKVLNYDEQGGILLDAQETRTLSVDVRGNPRIQLVATYAEVDENGTVKDDSFLDC